MTTGLTLSNRRVRTVTGAAFAVKQPKWSDEEPTRGKPVRLEVGSDHNGLFTLIVDGKTILSLNRDAAEALGLTLVRESDR